MYGTNGLMKFIVARLTSLQKLLVFAAFGAFALAASGQSTLVNFGATWKYLDDGSDQGTLWKDSGFADGTWLSGPAILGFNTDAPLIATTNASGHTTYYYRHAFNVPSIAGITNLRAGLRVDDGAVGYLNGAEVFRLNMPEGPITSTTGANGAIGGDGQDTNYISFSSASLQAGNNVLAVEVHQNTNTSSDVVFDLKLESNPTPFITISSPTNGQTIVGEVVTLRGTAVPGGQTVSLVEGFQGTTEIGETTNSSFAIPWTSVAPGNYTLRAKITDSSGLVATSAPVSITVQATPASVLIPLGSTWKYLDNGSDQGTAWRALAFDDSSWAQGPAELGYGDGGEATVVSFGPSATAKYATTYFRRKFNVSNPAAYGQLTLETVYDDGAIVYINGVEVHRVRIGPTDVINFDTYIGAGADYTPDVTTLANSVLVAGENTIAVEMHQSDAGSSDISFDLRLEGVIDTSAPTIVSTEPPEGTTQLSLGHINILFSEPVNGVNAADLLISNEPATNVVMVNPREFTFYFPLQPSGPVTVAFSASHGITDQAAVPNAFAGANWTYTVDPNASSGDFIITEFMAKNDNGIRDEDGSKEDWIEIHNRSPVDSSIEGWFLTDDSNDLTKWRFPAKIVAQNGYLIVFASDNDRTNASGPFLHTNFRLGTSGGGFLALVDPRTNIVSAFSGLSYPAQIGDVSYGRDATVTTAVGYYTNATPGAPNSLTQGAALAGEPTVTPASGVYTNDSILVTITPAAGTAVYYTLNAAAPTTNSTRYTAPFTVNAATTLRARAFATNDPTLFPSLMVARSYIFLDASTRDFNSKLPLIVISAPGVPFTQNIKTKGSVVVVDTFRGQASLRGNPDFVGMADFEVYGQTSSDPNNNKGKYPWNIELQDANGNDTDVSLLGFPADADWKTRNFSSDKSLMNDFLAFELWEEMGHYSVRRRHVEVFVDSGGGRLSYPGDYHGVHCFSERIEQGDDRVDINRLTSVHTNEPSISGGYMFKHDKDGTPGDIKFFTSPHVDGTLQLKLHEPKPREVNNNVNHPQVAWLRNYLTTMERMMYSNTWLTATSTNHYTHYLDVESFADSHWIVEFPKQIDGYRLSAYFTKDRNGKVKMSPIWDWNLSFGNANYLDGGNFDAWYYNQISEQQHIWLRRLINGGSAPTGVGDPDFCQRIADRWSVLRTNVLEVGRLTNRIDELTALISEAANRNFAKFVQLGQYVWPNPNGGTAWDVDYVSPTTHAGIIHEVKKWVIGRYNWIDAQHARRPEFNTAGGLVSPGFSVTISAPVGHTIYYTLNGDDPRMPGGALRAGALTYSGPITVTTNIRIFARTQRAGTWQSTWGGPNAISLYTALPNLRITEVMYHPHDPPDGSLFGDEDFEYVEVKNIGGTPLNLNRFSISGGIDFAFPNQNLAAGAYAVIVANSNAFRARYGNTIPVLGSYNTAGDTNRLDNGGERLILEGPMREPILDFRYSDEWYPITDGHGYSLVIRNENDSTTNWPFASAWRPSGQFGSSPGALDPAEPVIPQVVVNEIRTHTDSPQVDEIELHNLGGTTANISGWFLTDDFGNPYKYQIASPTSIGPNDFLVLNANQLGFELSSLGEEIYLFAGNGANVLGYVQGFDFGPLPNGATFGRHVISTGDDQFPIQAAPSLGNPNTGPLVGPIIISEIHYHPPDVTVDGVTYNNSEDEYIELNNNSGALARLYDQARPNNTWRLDDAVEFTFPPNTSIPAGGYLLVVNFDPANTALASAFRSRNGVPPGVPLYGPFSGQLNNGGEPVELRRPDVPEANGLVPYILVERITYDNEAPWSSVPDGVGPALQRISHTAYGNDPANWSGGGRSPGAAYVAGPAPQITSHPQNRTVIQGQTATFSVQVTGTGPFTYTWRHNGSPVPSGGGATLVLNNVQTSQAGSYDVVIFNASASVASTPATLSVLVPATVEPELQIVNGSTNLAVYGQSGSNVTFSANANATLTPPLVYQWRLNGAPIPGANQSVLAINNAALDDEGIYDVVITDAFNNVVPSRQARLQVNIRPFVTGNPELRNQTLSVGSTFNLPFGARGNPLPLTYLFRRGGTNYANFASSSFVGTLTIPNVQLTDAQSYTIIVSNIVGSVSPPGTRFFAHLVVVDPPASQTVTPGSDATLRANVRWSPQMPSPAANLRYQWLFNGSPINNATNTNFVVTAVQPANAGIYTLVVTNFQGTNATVGPVVATFDALLSIPEADGDTDGMPDSFEQRHNCLNQAINDANSDADGDGVSNINEYRSGTDPCSSQSYLRISSITLAPPGGVTLEFLASSNKTYSLLYRDLVQSGDWNRLQDFSLRPTNRVERLTDPAGNDRRFYRLTTPRAP
jgi:hypothetical protein